jgi:hypothetical protein
MSPVMYFTQLISFTYTMQQLAIKNKTGDKRGEYELGQ